MEQCKVCGNDYDNPLYVTHAPPASEAIVRRGSTKLAVVRDERAKLCEMPAVCPYRVCIVTWNSGEVTWDCPCHGSRFDDRGGVLNGRAKSALERQVGSAQSLTAARPQHPRRYGSRRVEKASSHGGGRR